MSIIERVIIFHGYSATPADHWFTWLADELAPAGIQVQVPALPDSATPDVETWIATASEAIGAPDQHTAIVTHSLGGVTALHALDTIDGDWTLGTLASVSGFVEPLPVLPELDPFTARVPDLSRTASRTTSRVVLLSDNDTIVPPHLSQNLARLLDAETITVPGAGHFLADEGITRLPELSRFLNQPGS